jgi:hypothetical protein
LTKPPPPPRLYVLLARDASVGAVFRRGPSKLTLLSKWDLKTDTMEHGQWFKGRIYERRCDLSPNGELLVYFAGNQKPPLHAWTAISRLPYLTALQLWRGIGTWGGGGFFEADDCLLIWHPDGKNILGHGQKSTPPMPPDFRLEAFDGPGNMSEITGVFRARMMRNGWSLIDEGKCNEPDWKADVTWRYEHPVIYEKQSATSCRLRLEIKGMHQKNGPWYWTDYEVWESSGKNIFCLPKIDWADWDKNGDLLFAKDGKLLRMNSRAITPDHIQRDAGTALVCDFSPLAFTEVVQPPETNHW